MWNETKQEEDEVKADASGARAERQAAGERSIGVSTGNQAIIGNSIRIQGEVTGDEDLTIQGHVDGSVNLDQHSVTVGADGDVQGDIVARVIAVEGQVNGDLTADEQIVVRSSARVEGDISAARVVLEDGAYFRGGVEMENASEGGGRTSSTAATRTKRTSKADSSPLSSAKKSDDEEEKSDDKKEKSDDKDSS